MFRYVDLVYIFNLLAFKQFRMKISLFMLTTTPISSPDL